MAYLKFKSNFLNSIHIATGYPRIMQIMNGLVPSVHTFGIMSVDNPQNTPLPATENNKRREKFRTELREKRKEEREEAFREELNHSHYGYIQHNGRYGGFEKAFFIMNARLEDMVSWCDTSYFDQESFIYGEVNHLKKEVLFTLFSGAIPGPQRKIVLFLDAGTQNYYSEYKGRKFVIPFFDDNYELSEASESSATNVPKGVPFTKEEVEANPANALHLATIYAGEEALRLDALGKTVGMCNYYKRGQLLSAVKKLRLL